MTESDDPVVLRHEISVLLDKVTDRGSLLFCQWLIMQISEDKPLPSLEEVKRLHGAFVRVEKAFRDKNKSIDRADLDLLVKYVDTGEVEMGRRLGEAVKFYRGQKKLSRLELSKRCRVPLKFILALERGQIKDMSMPRLQQLAVGLGVEPGVFVEKAMELRTANG